MINQINRLIGIVLIIIYFASKKNLYILAIYQGLCLSAYENLRIWGRKIHETMDRLLNGSFMYSIIRK